MLYIKVSRITVKIKLKDYWVVYNYMENKILILFLCNETITNGIST